MAETNHRAVTAAPRSARVAVTGAMLRPDGTVGDRLPDVPVQVKDLEEPNGPKPWYVLDSGLTTRTGSKKGTWRSKSVTAEQHTITVSLQGFRTQDGMISWVCCETLRPGENRYEVHLVKTDARVKARAEDPSNGNSAVAGVQLAFEGQDGQGTTDVGGNVLTPGVPAGTYNLIATKPGYGPTSAVEGPVKRQITIPSSDDVTLQPDIQICRVWRRVHNADITVAGQPFAQWYNKNYATWGPQFVTPISDTAAFADVFNNLALWWPAADMSVEEFVAMFLIMNNETGGGFKAITEIAFDGSGRLPVYDTRSLKYFFEPSKAGRGKKSSYNAGIGNIPAGTALLAGGHIPADRVDAWNGTQDYPVTDDERNAGLEDWAKECDFMKFRGRGFIQVTGRGNYVSSVEPHLTDAHLTSHGKNPVPGRKKIDLLSDADLTDVVLNDPGVKYKMVKSYFAPRAGTIGAANAYDWCTCGSAVNGGDYPDTFASRARKMFPELTKAGFVIGP